MFFFLQAEHNRVHIITLISHKSHTLSQITNNLPHITHILPHHTHPPTHHTHPPTSHIPSHITHSHTSHNHTLPHIHTSSHITQSYPHTHHTHPPTHHRLPYPYIPHPLTHLASSHDVWIETILGPYFSARFSFIHSLSQSPNMTRHFT